jgi:signal transduction histidine kinase
VLVTSIASTGTVGRGGRTAALWAWRGLIIVLAGRDPAPAWRSPWLRRAVFAALTLATAALLVASVASLRGEHLGLFNSLLTRTSPARVNPLAVRGPRSGFRLLRLLQHNQDAQAAATVAALVVVVPLALAARYPLMGWRIGWLALLAVPVTGANWQGTWPWNQAQLLVLLVVFWVAAGRHPRSVVWWMWALTLFPIWYWTGQYNQSLTGRALDIAGATAVAVAADALGARRRAQQALAGQAELTELEQARRAVLEERARIARELHDVVAHHMSLIAVRAETAPFRLAGLPEPVRTEFGSLSGAARDALADMRRLLGVLRYDQAAERAPQPQLRDLPVLIEAAQRAGVAVELTTAPELEHVPAGVGVCAYRIVQESLSNARRHAPGAAVTVSVSQDLGAVRLRVANGPGDAAGRPAGRPRPGHGLTGMRERVALLDGSLLVGPTPDGGFVVSAVLPVGAIA